MEGPLGPLHFGLVKLTSICTECVGLFTVNYGVDSGDFILGFHAEANGLIDRKANDEGKNEAIDKHRTCAD
jgi:hypothetical protein